MNEKEEKLLEQILKQIINNLCKEKLGLSLDELPLKYKLSGRTKTIIKNNLKSCRLDNIWELSEILKMNFHEIIQLIEKEWDSINK